VSHPVRSANPSLVAGAAGVANASPGMGVDEHAAPPIDAKVKAPRLEHGDLSIKGSSADDKVALRLRAGDPSTLQVDVGDDGTADFSFRRAAVARIDVDARAGDDSVRIDDGNGSFTDTIPTTIDGGAGNDTLAGGRGNETFLGGSGNDAVDGNGGDDRALLGSGDDTFVWDPGDGSDTIEGQSGADTLRFNGANAAERVELSANGHRLRFFRDVAKITMDTAGVERVDFNALGGADLVTVNDLSATDVRAVNVDLAGTLGGATGDGQADQVVVKGSNGNDAIDVSGDAAEVKVSGLAATVAILHPEAANDRLDIDTPAGHVSSAGLNANTIKLLVNGVLVP
jgi:Ca2+-binding RTX toxin-like protein